MTAPGELPAYEGPALRVLTPATTTARWGLLV